MKNLTTRSLVAHWVTAFGGGVFARHHDIALVPVIFIGLQNLPETFNAHDDLIESGMTTKRSYLISHMPDKWIPALGATIGFIFGMMGEKLIG